MTTSKAIEWLDRLWGLAQASGPGEILQSVETKLRDAGQGEMADRLNKLLQDAGVEIDKIFSAEPALPGSSSEQLYNAWEPVTEQRVEQVLREVYQSMDQVTRTAMQPLMQELKIFPDPISRA